jgi:hypothetical protein
MAIEELFCSYSTREGSKIAVMGVISFLHVQSLGSSTVYVVDAHAYVKKLISVIKTGTVLKEYAIEKQRSVIL